MEKKGFLALLLSILVSISLTLSIFDRSGYAALTWPWEWTAPSHAAGAPLGPYLGYSNAQSKLHNRIKHREAL